MQALPPLLVVAAAHSAGASGGSSMEHTSAGGGSQTQSGAQLDALLAHLQSGAASGGATGGTAHGQAAREAAGGGGAGAARAASSSQAAAARGPGSRLAARTTSEPRPTNSYNARHQQAEARRRSRINERLEALRQLVPHTERANTANFLEELVAYVQRMQGRVVELERQLGLQPSVQLATRAISFADDGPEHTMQTATGADRRAPQSLLGLPALPLPPAQQALPPLPMPAGHTQAVGTDANTAAAIAAALLQQQAQQAMMQHQHHQAQLQQLLLHGAAAAVTGLHPLQGFQGLQGLQMGGYKLPVPPTATQAGSAPMPATSQPATTAGPGTALASAAVAGNGGGAQSSGSRPGDSGGAQGSAGLQALAAADSLGALSAGCASGLRSASVHPVVAGEGARKRPEPLDANGIPTDEELASLHDHLTQDTKRPRLVPADA